MDLFKGKFDADVARLVGSGGAIAGSIMGLAGGVLTATGFGAVAGVPFMIAGVAVGGPGSFIIGGAYIGEAIKKNLKLKDVTKVLNDDRFQCIRIAILITRARKEDEIADGIGVSQEDAAKVFSVVVRSTGPAVSVGRGIAYGMIRAASAGLNIAGTILSGIMIPIDMAQFLIAAVSLYKRNKSGVVDEVDRLAEGLEIASWLTLRSLGFHVVFLEKYTEFKTVECTVLAVKEEAIEILLTMMQLDQSRYKEGSGNSLVLYKSHEMPNKFYYEKVFQVWERKKITFVRIPYRVSSD